LANCPQAIACGVNWTTNVPAVEDTQSFWNINVLFATQYETNTTQVSTSANFTVSSATLNSGCNVSFDSGSDNITVTPTANWFGLCSVRVSAASKTLTLGYNTTVAAYVTFNFSSVNDVPQKNESGWDAAVSPLTSLNQTGSVTLEGCRMFYDEDREDFTVSVAQTTTSGSAPSYTAGSCLCYSGNTTCPLKIQATGIWEGKLSFTARDPAGATVTVLHDLTVSSVNRAPVATSGNVTINAAENDESEIRKSFSSEFTDPDGNSLTYTLPDGFGSLTTQANFDNADLVIKINTSSNGNATSRVVASDGTLTATKWVTLIVSPVNDPVVVLSTLKDRSFSGASATNTTFDVAPFVSDEESTFAAGTLKCVAGTVSGGEAIVTFTKNIMLIQHRQETTGVSCSISCDDSTGSTETFNINIVNTLVNVAPVAKAFPSLTAVPPSTGQINVASYNFSDYFSDPNIYQTINYNVIASNSTAVSFSTISNTGFTVVMFSGASGSYTLNVTATDEKGGFNSSLVRVLAYVKVGCQAALNLFWNPTAPLTVDLASVCSSSNTFNVTFIENAIPLTIYDWVTPTLNGSRITFTANDSCVNGVYSGSATVTDSLGGTNTTSITLTTNNTASTLQPIKTNLSYLVSNSAANASYDGALQIISNQLTLNLIPLIKLCASQGPLEFKTGTVPDATQLPSDSPNVKIYADIDPSTGTDLILWGVPDAQLTHRMWQITVPIIAKDQSSSNEVNFTVKITKDVANL